MTPRSRKHGVWGRTVRWFTSSVQGPGSCLHHPDGYDLRLLWLFLAADAFFVVLHAVPAIPLLTSISPAFADPAFLLDTDRGLAESFQYVKLLWLCVALGAAARRRSEAIWLVWTMVFAALLVDDIFEVHEKLGARLSGILGMRDALGMRGQDMGELAVLGGAGILVAIVVGIACRGATRLFRGVSLRFAVLLGALACFGAGVDVLHMMVHRLPGMDTLFTVVEDGGELVVVSFLAWYGLAWSRRQGRSAPSPS